VIGRLATTAGISGEMIRDMMVQCVALRNLPTGLDCSASLGALSPQMQKIIGAPINPNWTRHLGSGTVLH